MPKHYLNVQNLLDQIKLEERIFAIQQKVSTEVGQMTEKSSNLLLEKEKELALNNRVAEIMNTNVIKLQFTIPQY